MADNSPGIPQKKPHRVTVRLSTKTVEKVEKIAASEDRPVGQVVRRLVESALRCQERQA